MELTPEQAVKNGAEWLDKVYPEWWMKIDVGTLSIEDGDTCICGQLFSIEGSCLTGYGVLADLIYDALPQDYNSTTAWETNHGFLGEDKTHNPLWVAEIKRRAEIGLVD